MYNNSGRSNSNPKCIVKADIQFSTVATKEVDSGGPQDLITRNFIR